MKLSINKDLLNRLDLIEQQKVVLMQKLNLISIFSATIFVIVNLVVQRMPQFFVAIGTILFVFLPVFYFQGKGFFLLARSYYIGFTGAAIAAVSFYNSAMIDGVESEYLLIPLALMLIVFYDRYLKNGLLICTVTLFVALRILRYHYIGQLDQMEIYINMIVILVSFGMVYYFVNAYKKSISKLVRTQEKLNAQLSEQKDHMEEVITTKDRLISIVAHDLRKPFNLLNGLLYMEENEDLSEENKQGFKKKIHEYLEGLNGMMENLLSWTMSQLEGFKVDKENLRLVEVMEKVIGVYASIAEEKQVKIVKDVPDETTITADENSIRLVLRNLLSNSIKYSDKGGEVLISSITENSHINIIISDQGKGMDQETISRVLSSELVEPAFGTAGESGAGLGLSLCSEILAKNGGRLHIESTPSTGTRFIVSLPL